MGTHVLMQSMSLAAEHEGGGRGVVDLVIELVAAFIEAIGPEAALLQFLQGLSDVAGSHDGKVFERSGCGFRYCFGYAGGTAFGNDYCVRPCRMRGSYDGSQIVRIFDAVEDHHQLRGFANGFKIGIAVLGRECDHSLVVGLRRCPIQRRARLKAYQRTVAAAQVDEFLNARTAGSARDQHVIQMPPRAQGFANRMNACDDVHQSRLRVLAAGYWEFMSESPEVFELAIAVAPADIDQLGHVNNVTYVRWVQDAAVAHWTSAAPAADQAQLFWVVVRHEVDYKRPAVLGDRVVARTWVGTASRIRFERHTEIVRASDRTLLAKALTIWCPMDAQTGKPAAVSAEVRARFSVASK